MAVVYSTLSVTPVVVGILLSVSGSVWSVDCLQTYKLVLWPATFSLDTPPSNTRHESLCFGGTLLWPILHRYGETVTSLREQNPICTTTTLCYRSPSLLWLFLGGILEKQTYLYFWRQSMLAKLLVLLEISFLPILGTVQLTEALYISEYLLSFHLVLGKSWVELWIREEIKEEKKKQRSKPRGMNVRDLDFQSRVEHSELPAWSSREEQFFALIC